MALPPQKFREIVFQLLYSHGFSPVASDDAVPFMMQELKVTRSSVAAAYERVEAIAPHITALDKQIEAHCRDYAFERISGVERTILRLGAFELLHDSKLPPKVAIAEAIRLCRKFGTRESADFVNAVLDAVYKGIVSGSESPKEPVSL